MPLGPGLPGGYALHKFEFWEVFSLVLGGFPLGGIESAPARVLGSMSCTAQCAAEIEMAPQAVP